MKKLLLIIITLTLVAVLSIIGYKVLEKTKKDSIEIMEVKPNEYLSQDEEEVTKIVEEVLQDEKIQRIEDKNKKINKTIQTVLKKYNGQMDAEQIKEIVIKKIG
jgi:Glu-tRNA(Gln) amidotransferase subunit E-like FAD-binding protein